MENAICHKCGEKISKLKVSAIYYLPSFILRAMGLKCEKCRESLNIKNIKHSIEFERLIEQAEEDQCDAEKKHRYK